jgi:hypothetical protein
MTVKVTVVVPTYNSGRLIEPLIDSMLRQSLPRDEFEVLFVDDGSKDDTPALLEALAAEHDHFRVIRIPNSGWPGKPRNIGVEQARGEYVQFLDHDDRMAPEALERLYETARRNRSDIVIGKAASNFTKRGVAHGLMSRTRESCTVWNAPLIDSLTPHKMFRTAFLREHGIVHPEGPWILEDQLFMVRAYLKASVVSIPGDHVSYYYWAREDEGNSGGAQWEPRTYYANLAFTGQLHAADGPVGVTTTAADHHALAPAALPRPLLDRFAAEPLTGGAAPDKASAVLVLRRRAPAAYGRHRDPRRRRPDGHRHGGPRPRHRGQRCTARRRRLGPVRAPDRTRLDQVRPARLTTRDGRARAAHGRSAPDSAGPSHHAVLDETTCPCAWPCPSRRSSRRRSRSRACCGGWSGGCGVAERR